MMKRKIVLISLCLAIILTVGHSAFASIGTNDLDIYECGRLQSEAIEAFSLFCTDILYQDGIPDSDFSPRPVWYGGAFMNEQYELCIKVLPGYDDIRSMILECLKSYPVLLFTTDISYNELADTFVEIRTEYKGWLSLLLNQIESKVVVRIDPEDESCQEMIEDISGRYSCVVFEESARPSTFTNIIGGNPLRAGSTTGFGTVGFSCQYKPEGSNTLIDGFLTAGHVVRHASEYNYSLYLGDDTTYPINYSAYNSIVQFDNNCFGDYAFLPANGNTLTNLVRISFIWTTSVTDAYTSTYQSLLTGTYVVKFGNTTGLTSGILMGTSTTTYSSSDNSYITINGVWEVYGSGFSDSHKIADRGDSGGPVWQITSGVNRIMGILSGGINDPDDPTLSGKIFYFTPFYSMGVNGLEYDEDYALQLS